MNQNGTRRWFGSWLQIGLGLIVGAGALYLAARGIDLLKLAEALQAVRLPFVFLALITGLLTPVIKAQRWRWLFYPNRPNLSLLRLADLVVIGQAVNFLIPARLGEVVRVYLTGEEAGISKAYVLGTLAAEKLLDLVVLALLVVSLIPFLPIPGWMAGRTGPILVTTALVCVATGVLLGRRRLLLRLVDWAFRPLSPASAARWRTWIGSGLDGLAALGDRRAAVAIWGWTAAFWAVAGLTNLLLLVAFGLPASALIALFVLAVLQGGVAVPSTPGKIGVFHYLSVLALSVFGVPAATALAYGLMLHVLVVGSISAWAAIALWRRSWSMSRLARAASRGGELSSRA